MSKDSELQHSVLAEFSWEPSVAAGHIRVTANAGVVTLSGHVDSYASKHAAETAAGRVKGVRAVAEEIEVRLPFDMKRSDQDIAAAAIERLSWNVSVPKGSVQANVEKGWVTLTGQVEWWYQKEAAGHDIRPLHGVVGVSNQVTIKPRVNEAALTDDITHALHRSWFFDPQQVHVRANGGSVVLSGVVYSHYERQVAARTAWSAPGTTNVENDIAVV
jgi:osmotically-inducible protein OsmY